MKQIHLTPQTTPPPPIFSHPTHHTPLYFSHPTHHPPPYSYLVSPIQLFSINSQSHHSTIPAIIGHVVPKSLFFTIDNFTDLVAFKYFLLSLSHLLIITHAPHAPSDVGPSSSCSSPQARRRYLTTLKVVSRIFSSVFSLVRDKHTRPKVSPPPLPICPPPPPSPAMSDFEAHLDKEIRKCDRQLMMSQCFRQETTEGVTVYISKEVYI